MKIVLQRVSQAAVRVDDSVVGEIQKGYLLLVGFKKGDTEEHFDFMIRKILNLKLFEGEERRMNKSLLDIDGAILAVSQFTLYARVQNGNAPGWDDAMPYDEAEKLFTRFCEELKSAYKEDRIETGVFGAEMKVTLENDGPVTLILEK